MDRCPQNGSQLRYRRGGNSERVENFRSVSVLLVSVKVYVSAIGSLTAVYTYMYLQEHNLLKSAQFEFTPGHLTQDAWVSLVAEWREVLDDDILVVSVFIDFSKAFDMVNHCRSFPGIE